MNDGMLKPSSSIQALFQVNVAALVVGRETHSKSGYRLIASRAYTKGLNVFTGNYKRTNIVPTTKPNPNSSSPTDPMRQFQTHGSN